MPKSACYVLLLMLLLVSTGCETIHGMVTGFGQDVHNITNPDKNGWHAIQKTNDWVSKTLW
jgi:hypothetical protein